MSTPSRGIRSTLITTILLAALVIGACTTPQTRPAETTWIAGWISAPSWRPQTPRDNDMWSFTNQSVRQDVRVGVATDHIRLRVSNELGDAPIEVGHVAIARLGPGNALEGSPVMAQFAGQESVTLNPGQALLSDSIALKVPAHADLAISVYYPHAARPVAHGLSVRVSDGAAMPGSDVKTVRGPAIVSAVEVAANPATAPKVIVAFGDSITEGARSTPGAHADWPSVLGTRLEQSCPGGFVVLNAGISGNHVLTDGGSPSALSRLDRDVLSVAGVSEVIFLEAINDIRRADDSADATVEGTANDLIAGYRQIVSRLHARGIKVIGATLVPYKGTARQTDRGLAIVARVNEAIRSGSVFDGVIDFYEALDDPANPGGMQPAMQSGDWLHPGDRGYAGMAEAIPTTLLGPCKRSGAAASSAAGS